MVHIMNCIFVFYNFHEHKVPQCRDTLLCIRSVLIDRHDMHHSVF
jgi:hypothetical protein